MDTKPAEPNQSPFPAHITNDPVLGPFLRLGGLYRLGEVPEETALGSMVGGTDFMDQNPRDSLLALRLQFPFMEILPFGSVNRSILLAANTPQDFNIPDGIVALVMRGNNDYYVCDQGNADVPTAANNSHSVYKPEGYILYVGGKRSLSICAPNNNTVVSIMCYPLVPMRP